MDFDTWLEETKKAIATVEGEVAALGTVLDIVLADAQNRLAETRAFGAAAALFEGSGSELSVQADMAGGVRKTLAMLQHDIEIVITKAFLYQRAGIDLARLLPAYTGELDSKIEQDGIATVTHKSLNPCDLPVEGQNSLAVPLKLSFLGQTNSFRLHMNFAPHFPAAGTARLAVGLTRLPSACATDLAPAMAGQIEDRAGIEMARALSAAVVDLPNIDFLPINPRFQATWIDSDLRCLGSGAKRARQRRALLPAVPAGFAIAVKLDQEAVWQIVRQEVAAIGAMLFSGPTVTSPKTFTLTAGMRQSGSIKAGCDVVGWTVTVTTTVRFEVVVRNDRMLVISGQHVGPPDVDIRIRPDILGWLLGSLTDLAEGYVRNQIPALENIEKRFWLNSARQLDANFWNESIVFAINV